MKYLFKLVVVQLACISLLAQDALARGFGGGDGRSDRGRTSASSGRSAAQSSRAVSRPSSSGSSSSRNPFTGSKASRPSSRPEVSRPSTNRPSVSRPTTRPEARPSTRPEARPTTRPSTLPSTRPEARPSARPEARPSTRPEVGPSTRPTTRPAERPATLPSNRPSTRPSAKPGNVTYPKPDRPMTLPGTRPGGGRPSTLPGNVRPGDRPGTINRPETLPGNVRPGDRPGTINRPETLPGNVRPGDRPGTINRPETLPGNVRPGDRPGTINRPETLPGNVRPGDRPGIGNRPNRPETLPGIVDRPGRPGNRPDSRPGWNNKPIQRPNFNRPDIDINNRPNININNRPGHNNNWWNSGNSGWGNNYRPGIGNGIGNDIYINNNFQKNLNWSTNRNNWGYNPWWNRPATRPWYGGSWNCGWNNRWYNHNHHYHYHHYWGGYRPLPGYVVYDDDDNDFMEAVGWGLAAWGLGSLIFNSGYNTYRNPYPAQPVPTTTGTPVTYSQPITIVAAQTAPKEEAAIAASTEKSESYVQQSQEAFKQKNYLVALEAANKAVGEQPGDGALHEYRALVLFALGKFGEAAGVLNPVLASGPGWDWTTMVTLYDSQETYTSQLKALENYAAAKPADAAAQFLLGYHYMVCGYLAEAAARFEAAAKLQPADTTSKQLADLCKASSNSADQDAAPAAEQPPPADTPPPAPVPLDKLAGSWTADKGEGGVINLTLKDDGTYLWAYTPKGGARSEFTGEYSMNDNGLLVLDTEGSQMVAAVELPQDSELKFVLAGGPPGDPGLSFKKG